MSRNHNRGPKKASRFADLAKAWVDEDPFEPAPPRDPFDLASASLANACLGAALPGPVRRAVLRGDPIAIVVAVPGPSWVKPVEAAFRALRADIHLMARDGSARRDHKPDIGNAAISEPLARGTPTIGISQSPDAYLPAALVAGADARLDVRSPDAATFRRVLRACGVRRVPRSIPDAPCGGLTFDEIVSAIRVGASGPAVLATLARMSAHKSGSGGAGDAVPPLRDLPGFSGEARVWGEALIDGFARWRRGECAFRDLDASAVIVGPPGVGKSYFVRSLACGLGVPLHATSVGSWFAQSDGALGGVTQAFQKSWDAAIADARAGGAVWMCDELDALPDRARLSDRAREWWTALISLVLTATDGATTDRAGLVLLGCSNAGSFAAPTASLDAALTRQGRFSRILWVDMPSASDLAAVTSFGLDGALSPADLLPAVRLATGASAADATAWARDARNAAAAKGRAVEVADVVAAIAPADTRSTDEVRRAAVHEAGHAVVALAVGQPLESASIVGAGRSGGRTTIGTPAMATPTAHDFNRAVVVALSGRAAEELLLGAPSTGAEGDLAKATAALAAMVVSTGLAGALTHLAPSGAATDMLRLDAGLRRMVEQRLAKLYAESMTLIGAHRGEVAAVAEALVARRFLTGVEVTAIIEATVGNQTGGSHVQ